ncbi:MAG: hypothetical protein P4L22_05000 [Candidatus Babeliales bacterium]|nr:hypothetical protein [Candidatus Babeliales bacterium]
MKKSSNSTLIGFVFLGLLAVVGYYLLRTYKSISKNPSPEYCEASSASWQTPEQCASQQGHYIAGDKVCQDVKFLGDKSNAKEVCCVSCTDDTIVDNG